MSFHLSITFPCVKVTKCKARTSGKSWSSPDSLDPLVCLGVAVGVLLFTEGIAFMSVVASGQHFPLFAPQMKLCTLVYKQDLLHCQLLVVAPSEKCAGGFDYKSNSVSERNQETFGNLIITLKM